ncbi:MAG: NAD(+)/NADH kinase [bacterium]
MKHKEIRTVALFIKPGKKETRILGKEIMDWLKNKKIQVLASPVVFDELNTKADGIVTEPEYDFTDVDLALVLGGDGTILWVARRVAPFNVPVLSFNMGDLGFLAAYSVDDVYSKLEKTLGGDYSVEERMMLTAEHYRDDALLHTYSALNDVAVNKLLNPRLIKLEMCVNETLINTYQCDGLIVSTPTGSTAYSLSAGGPIMIPYIHAVVVTPICPHMLTNRPIVLCSSDIISIRQISEDRKVFLIIDGQTGSAMNHDDVVVIREAPFKARVITNPDAPFFHVLRHKLAWGKR